ncbi:sugar phosphate isomerase/epimerase family protein [Jiangella aurantiaca]|nr:sugar phosphate isomerase/epimerase [Jiangella aurantiaca]
MTGAGWELWLHSMATPETDAVGCLRVAQRLGLDGVELIVDEEYPAALPLDAGSAVMNAVGVVAADLGLRVGALCSYVRDIDADSEHRRRAAVDELRRTVDLATAVGAAHVRVLAGHDHDGDVRPAAVRRAARSLAEASEHAGEAGVSLNVENHMDTLATSARATRQLVEAAAAPAVGILYDQANLAIMAAEGAATAVRLQASYIRHVHLKNFLPGVPERRPAGLAAGVVDWRTVLPLLGFHCGAVTFEYERRWFPDQLPPAELGLPPDIAWLRGIRASS